MAFENERLLVLRLALIYVILLAVGFVVDQSDWYAEVAGEFLAVLVDIIGTGAVNDDMRWLQTTISRPGFA